MTEISFKKLSDNAVIPKKVHITDAGFDLVCTNTSYNASQRIITYGTDIAVAIPDGYVGLLVPRSSVYKKPLTLANCCGIIDSGYRGEIMFKYRYEYDNGFDCDDLYVVGDRVGQLVIVPCPQFTSKEVDELPEGDRGDNGFGSTGA